MRNLAATCRLLWLPFDTAHQANVEKTIDELISSAKALDDEDLRWITKLPKHAEPLLRQGLTRMATSVLSRGIHILPAVEQQKAAGLNDENFEVIDLTFATRIEAMVKDLANPCKAVQVAVQGKQPVKAEFQACVLWCGEMGCMEVAAAIQQRWPAFSNLLQLDGSKKQIPMLESILSHGIASDVAVKIYGDEDIKHLQSALEAKAINTLGIVFRLEKEVPDSLARTLATMKLRGLALTSHAPSARLAPEFLRALLLSESIEHFTLVGEFTAEIESHEVCSWIIQGKVRSLHVRSSVSLVNLFGNAVVEAGERGKLVDLELLSPQAGEVPTFSWILKLFDPKLGIPRLALDEMQLALIRPWQWDNVSNINHSLVELRPVTANFKRCGPPRKAAALLDRNRAFRWLRTGWIVDALMKSWAGADVIPWRFQA